jgi:two-component system, NtrC family, sensor histidine kinase HydH
VAVHSLSALLAAIVTLAIGFSVVLRENRTRPQTYLAGLCFNLAAWHLGSFLHVTFNHPVWLLIATLFAVAIPLSAARFFACYLGPHPQLPPRLPRPLVLSAVVLYVALALALIFRPKHLEAPLGAWVMGHVFGGLIAVVWLIDHRRHEAQSPVERTRLLYLLVGAAASVMLSLADLVPGLRSGGKVVSNVFVVIYIYFLTQAVFRYRLLDLNDILGRIAVLAVLVLTLATFYGLLLAWVSEAQRGIFFFNTLVASFVVLVLIDPLRHAVEGAINRLLFRERSELRTRLDQLKRELASVIDVRETVSRVLRRLEETHRVTDASVYLIDADGSGFDLDDCFGAPPAARLDGALRRPFLDRLRREGVLAVEGIERELSARGGPGPDAESERLGSLAQTFTDLRASLCLALSSDDMLLGLLCLRDERLREAYSSEEIDLLRQVAAQVTVTLQNSKLYERMKERARLAAIGEMAAGLAHEIRNPLGAIKGAAQLLQAAEGPAAEGLAARGGSAPPEGEALRIIVEEANRLNNVVSQFLDYARPYRGDQTLLDLCTVVRRTVALLEQEQLAARVTLTLDLAPELPQVRADAEQLRQVFLNLGLNALQAMGEAGGQLTVAARLRHGTLRGQPAEFVEASFRDTGPGIKEEDLPHLFIPFYTTKDKGTGLGLPICQRIVENHGGTIEVRSTPGEGARVTVVLPVEADARTGIAPSAPAGPDARAGSRPAPAGVAADVAGAGGVAADAAGAGGAAVDAAGAGGVAVDAAGAGGVAVDAAGAGGVAVDAAGAGGVAVNAAGAGGVSADVAGRGGSV